MGSHRSILKTKAKQFYSAKSAAQALGISDRTLTRYCSQLGFKPWTQNLSGPHGHGVMILTVKEIAKLREALRVRV
jgi:hypothetical protein